jgi:hypothetical protein
MASLLVACGGGGVGGAGALPASVGSQGPTSSISAPASAPPSAGASSSPKPGATSTPKAGATATPVPLTTPTPGAVPTPSPTPTSATPKPAAGSALLGGYEADNSIYNAHASGDTYEYSENVAVTFPMVASSNFAYTITGNDGSTPPSSVYWESYGKVADITVRKVPGVVYTLRVTSPMSYTATFTTAAKPQMPAPIMSTIGQPYRYGVLSHPFPGFLGSISCSGPGGYGGTCTLQASSLEEVQLMCNAHVRFVRIDYTAGQILDKNSAFFNSPDFTKEDAIMDQLAKCGITELPVIVQYAAGAVMTNEESSSLPMQFASSSDPHDTAHIPGYADFAKIVVQHLMSKYPQITRVELFNEPNNSGWGTFPVGGNYATTDRSGAEASVYMSAAYAAIKSVDPRMTVVGPALSDGGTTTDPRKFLQTMISDGCHPGTCYDVFSVHNYDWENPTFQPNQGYMGRWNIYQTLQGILAQNGYPGVHVMLTEWGFSTIMMPVGFDPAVQAQYVALGFNLMLADPTVDGIVYVNMYNGGTDFWGNTALTTQSYQLKLGYQVFSSFASR